MERLSWWTNQQRVRWYLLSRTPPLPCSRALGLTARWIRARLARTVLWVLIVATSVWLVDVVAGEPLHLPKASWPDAARIVVLLEFSALRFVLNARRGMRIEEFIDHISAEPKSTNGFAQRLVHELDRLTELYRAADERRPVSTVADKTGPIGTRIDVDGNTDFLRRDLTAEGDLKLGPLSIPMRTAGALLARAVRGPRITGGLHRDGTSLTLIAQTSGWRPSAGWKVERTAVTSADADQALGSMTEELAYRVFTDRA